MNVKFSLIWGGDDGVLQQGKGGVSARRHVQTQSSFTCFLCAMLLYYTWHWMWRTVRAMLFGFWQLLLLSFGSSRWYCGADRDSSDLSAAPLPCHVFTVMERDQTTFGLSEWMMGTWDQPGWVLTACWCKFKKKKRRKRWYLKWTKQFHL